VDAAWNAAYLESLNNKETWINYALASAAKAFDTNLLTLVGSDAESYSRRLDGFMPSSLPGSGTAEKAAEALQKVLGSAGIVNLNSAFISMAGSAGTVSTVVKSGLSGLGVWNSGQARAAANEFAWNSTNDLAGGKMALLAFQARESVYEAKKALEENVVRGNKSVDDNINELYTVNGGWKRSQNSYIKDIIVHSTVFSSAITDKITLDAYRWFVLENWDFTTDLSETNLDGLNYLGIQAVIGMAQEEVKEKSKALFGSDGSGGDFGAWVGEAPLNGDEQGTGELGRLIREFYKWEAKQDNGIALMNAALWDKPLWDSRGSWFSAPTIRGTVDLMTSVAATVVGAVLTPITAGGSIALAFAINMSDDLLFGALDVGYGYKSWDEAGVEFGRKALINAATTVVGAAFNGVTDGFIGLTKMAANNTSGFITPIVKAGMSGAQAFTASTVTSALSAVTYNNGRFGWSQDAFTAGIKSGLISAAVAGTSTLTSGMMNLGLEGFYDQYYTNGEKLSSLVGGLAGQGVNYAFGGDITLNAFYLTIMNKKNETLADTGLLELHFGRDGFSGNLGSGGVDVRMGTLASAFQGLEAWKVNFDIWTSDSDDAKKYISQMRSLYSGDKTNNELYHSILAKETFVAENRGVDYTRTEYDPVTGAKIIYLGNDALEDGSRFGLNVVFSHESYRNGEYDGVEGQRQETDMAVFGHICTALGLMQTYGEGALGAAMAGEANKFSDNFKTLISEDATELQKMQAYAGIFGTLSGYDSSSDFWRMKYDGTLVSDNFGWLRDENGYYINSDGTRTKTWTKKTIGAASIKDGLLNILFGGKNFTDSQVAVAESILISAGLSKDGEGLKGIKLYMDYVMRIAGDTVANEVFKAYYNNTIDYHIANKYGIDLIFNKRDNWNPNAVYNRAKERYDKLAESTAYHYAINGGFEKSLMDKYLQTVITDDGGTAKVLKITADNPYISKVLGQNDPAFSNKISPNYNYVLRNWGCNFMSTIAVPQLLTGNVLKASEVNAVWNWAAETKNPIRWSYNNVITGSGDLGGNVNNPNMLANYVLQNVFGYKNYNLTIINNYVNKPKETIVTNLVAVKEQYDPTHFVLTNLKLEKVYEPWPSITRPHQRYDGIFLNIGRARYGN
jgi:hypothetical protein